MAKDTKQRVTISLDAEIYDEIQKHKNDKSFNLSQILNSALIQYFEGIEVTELFTQHERFIEDKLDKAIHKNTRQHTYMLNQIYRVLNQIFYFSKAIVLQKLDKGEAIIEVAKELSDKDIQSAKRDYKNIEDKDLVSNFSNMNAKD